MGAIALSVIVTTASAIALAYLLPVKYRAETLLKPAQGNSPLDAPLGLAGGLAGLAGLALRPNDRSAEAVAFLESKAFTMDFVRSNDLLPVLFPKLWDAEARQWRVDDPDDAPTELDAYRLFRDNIRTVSESGGNQMVLLAIEWGDAERAARWANDMVDAVNAKMREDAVARSKRNLEYLRKEYENTSVTPVRDAVARLMENELQTSMMASAQPDYGFRVIDPAVVPNRRSSPNRALIAASGVVLGLALGLLIALGRAAPRR